MNNNEVKVTSLTNAKNNNNNNNNTKIKAYPLWHNTVSGGVAGGGSRLITAPLDIIKIRRQLQGHSSFHVRPPPSSCGGLISSLFEIARSEGGIRALFRGNVSATYLWVGYSAIQFSVYSHVSEAITTESKPSTTVAFTSGAIAGVVATAGTYPFDICRTIFAARGLATKCAGGPMMEPPASLIDFATIMYETNGGRGFFAGMSPAMAQIVPYTGLNFAIYDFLMRWMERDDAKGAGMAGFVSGGVSKLAVYPLDTVKKRLQVQTFTPSLVGPTHRMSNPNNVSLSLKYHGMLDCFVRIGKEEGILAFYRGLLPTVIKSMLATATTFAFFTSTKTCLEKIHDKDYVYL